MSLTRNGLRTYKLFAFFLYFTIMLFGPEFLPPSWKHMPVFEGHINYHQDVLSSASVLNILDQDTTLGILLMSREHGKKYSGIYLEQISWVAFVFLESKTSGCQTGSLWLSWEWNSFFRTPVQCFSNKREQLCFSTRDFWTLHLTVALKTVWNDIAV